jgi:hypothetical protein
MNFLDRLPSQSPISSFTQIHPVGALLIHTDRWMDTTKLIATFQDYTNMPKMQASATLKMEAESSSEMSTSTHQTAVSYASRM